MLLPLLGGFTGILAAIPLVLAQLLFSGNSSLQYAMYAITIFLGSLITTFFSVALAAGAHARLDGQNPDLTYCIGVAKSRLRSVVLWALFATVVGLVIRMIEQRLKGVAGVILRFLGDLAFALASSFVIPIIAERDAMPIDALKTSAQVLRAKWGSLGRFSLRSLLYVFLIVIGAVVAVVLSVVAMAASLPLGVLVAAVSAVGLFYVVLWMNAVHQYAVVVLYRFSVGRPTPGFSNDEILAAAVPR